MAKANKAAANAAEKEKSYKTQHDPSRVYHLISACSLLRDFPSASAVAATFMKELEGLNAKQVELVAAAATSPVPQQLDERSYPWK
jgi:hypothetical protein